MSSALSLRDKGAHSWSNYLSRMYSIKSIVFYLSFLPPKPRRLITRLPFARNLRMTFLTDAGCIPNSYAVWLYEFATWLTSVRLPKWIFTICFYCMMERVRYMHLRLRGFTYNQRLLATFKRRFYRGEQVSYFQSVDQALYSLKF